MRAQHAGWLEAVNVDAEVLPDDPDAQVARTIARMRELAREDAGSAFVRDLARGFPAGERACAEAAFWFVRGLVRFQRDAQLVPDVPFAPEIIEVLIRPVDLLSMARPRGDCDDFCMALASLLVARGIGCSFATVAADPRDPSRFSHVYVVAHLAGGDLPLDASHGRRPGWEVRNVYGKKRVWRVDSVNTGMGFAATATTQSDPAWLQIVKGGLDFVKGRFGTPENTLVRMPDGTLVTRGSSTMAPTGTPTDVRADVRTTQQSDFMSSAGWILAAGAVMVFLVVIVMASKGGKR